MGKEEASKVAAARSTCTIELSEGDPTNLKDGTFLDDLTDL